MNLTKVLRPYFIRRLSALDRANADVEATQKRVLRELVGRARNTLWGREHSFRSIAGYDDFTSRLNVTPYDQLRPLVMRMIAGEKNLLWPGLTLRYAQSSGTSDGKSKYIPVTADSLRLNHYRGSADVVARYLGLYPDSRIFSGRSFILAGSFANELNLPTHTRTRVGDLSANLIEAMNPLANLVRIPSKEIALMQDWHTKLPALIEAASRANVTNISGVPSWFLTVLQGILHATGAKEIHEVWPNLEVFFHGGISFLPYRSQYDAIIDPSRMHYLETYNASEGFFAVQNDFKDKSMLLIIDRDIFYEFIPVDGDDPTPRTIWEVNTGDVYELVISSSNGLWRYHLGDTVRVTQTSPVKIRIA